MMRLKLTALSAFALLFLSMPMLAQETTTSDSKLAELERIADEMGLRDIIVEKFRNEFMGSDEVMDAPISDEAKLKLQELLVERFDVNDFVGDVILPAVERHFSAEDLSMLGDFISSDLGRKVISSEMEGGDYDIEAAIKNGELSEAEMMSVMTLFVKLGPKLEKIGDSIGAEIEEAAEVWGEAFLAETFTEMINAATATD